MDSLLCDEVWLSSPKTPDYYNEQQCRSGEIIGCHGLFCVTTKEDCEQALAISLEKELSYMPKPGYVDRLHSQDLIFARFRAIQWLIKSRSRLNLSFATIFNAANYLDRFLSINQCHGWKYWMVELLSVACLSVAVKFSDSCNLSLQEIQMEDLDHSFESINIQRMEIMLLQSLEWRLGSTTAYSYVEMLPMNIDSLKSHFQKDLAARVTKLLLGAMLDSKLVEYRPSIVAISALWCSLDELVPSMSNNYLMHITSLFNKIEKDALTKCHKYMMEALVASGNPYNYYPSSPVTVLLTERIEIYDGHVDLSIFKVPGSNIIFNLIEPSKNKRKKEEN